MVSLKFAALAAAALSSFTAFAQVGDAADGVTVEDAPEANMADVNLEDLNKMMADSADEKSQQGRPLNVGINVSFPDAEIFGVKLVNGRPTRALIHVTNQEDTDVNFLVAAGALLTPTDVPGAPDPPQVIRNLTGTRFGAVVPPKTKETFTYTFSTVMHPQDLNLELKTIISRGPTLFTLQVFSETVSIVEAPVSIFDPQIIFLYLFLAGAFGGTCYFIYTTWITTLFPQKKRGGKGGERAKRSTGGKPVDPADQVAVTGADGPAVTTSSKAYDESWIPAGHLNKPQARKVGGGRPKSRAA